MLVALDGTASSDLDGDSLDYSWSGDCPEGSLDDASLAAPTLSIDTGSGGTVTCNVTLIVGDDAENDSCELLVIVEDTDGDGVADVCDNRPRDVNPDQEDSNGNGTGDACDTMGGPELAIDISPMRLPKYIILSVNYTIYVAVMAAPDFDPASVDWTTVRFGQTGTEASSVVPPYIAFDFNGDGLPDALYGFLMFDSGFELGDEVGILKGDLADGTSVQSEDSVTVLP